MNSDNAARADATIPALKCACTHFARIDEVTTCRFCDCTEHRPAQAYDPQTPPDAEARLQAYADALEEASQALALARNAELDAENDRDKARRRAQLSADCPKVGVFGGVRTTVAYQKAWIEQEVEEQEQAYRLARETRRAAADHLRKVEKQGGFQQSIAASVRTSFAGQWGDRR